MIPAQKNSIFNLYKNIDRLYWPINIPGVGLLFGEYVYSYYVENNSTSAEYLPFPPMFAIEAWVKYDVNHTLDDAIPRTIFGKFTSSNPTNSSDRTVIVGFGLANSWMRIYINSIYYDFDYPFSENYAWQHISVQYDL